MTTAFKIKNLVIVFMDGTPQKHWHSTQMKKIKTACFLRREEAFI